MMMIYQQVTGNTWTPADTKTYQQIKTIPLKVIESAIRIATNRAASETKKTRPKGKKEKLVASLTLLGEIE